ncbi:putative ABC transport system permease protein [Natronoarchaeum philippinense]|uniref:Putative ABC transport system permease protein n=1 Tax=Natronoarchaeum philippinense TaxID=558529 RepID=A0A285N6D8_NATPI|nr:ABC transporter permease [Natronoarchaeum philippinense]SNZ04868.1 putative ABC transport system permease protein [Natronoarchaeum philippinense]
MADDGDRTRRARWRGLLGVSAARLWKQATATRTGRIAATTAAVGTTIAVLLIVTGVALSLAEAGVVSSSDADVRIVPTEGETLTGVSGVEPARLGATNERARQLQSADGVDHASPVLVEPVRLAETGGNASALVLLVGVVPDENGRSVAGLSTAALEPGDPHYANGSYDGQRRSQIVLSETAAERVGATAGDSVAVGGNRTEADAAALSVAAVESSSGNEGDADVPVALIHLSELQSLSGADTGELADRVLVWGDADAAASAASEAYPNATVETPGGADPTALFDDGLAVATSLVALVVGVTICAAFVATTMGIAVNEDRRLLAVLAAIGFSTPSRLVIVGVSTLVTTLVGAIFGIVGGAAGIVAVDAVAGATVASRSVAAFHPVMIPYALAAALLSGVIAAPYPLVVAARTSVLDEVGR